MRPAALTLVCLRWAVCAYAAWIGYYHGAWAGARLAGRDCRLAWAPPGMRCA